MNNLVLLPSSKLIPPELRVEFGDIPSGMIPLGSKPSIQYIAEPYVEQGYDVLLAAHEQADLLASYLERHDELRARLVDVGRTTCLGETVYRALTDPMIDTLPGKLIVNFADTYVADKLNCDNVIYHYRQDDVFRWTTFQLDGEQRIVTISEKEREKHNGALLIFVGVFCIGDARTFIVDLEKSLLERSDDIDPFYTATAAYFNRLKPEEKSFQKAEKWFDFGHLDTYYTTKRTFFLNQRCFNEVTVDSTRGILKKRSSKTNKFINEVKWYMKLPKSLQHIAPRVFDFGLDPDKPFVELEFYGYPALNDLFLFSNFDMGFWRQVIMAIDHVLREMIVYRYEPGDRAELVSSMKEMYEHKTFERLEKILSDPRFSLFHSDELRVNGEKCLGLPECLKLIPSALQSFGIYESQYFTLIHGDLCLSNILYDRKNGFIRVIDPRGEFGSLDIYGDTRYDLAKLAHSFEGGYDFIVNGLFDLHFSGPDITFNIHRNAIHETITRMFHDWLIKFRPDEYLQIKLIESLLFLSMVPLHSDKYESQLGFLVQGLRTFSRLLGTDGNTCTTGSTVR